MNHPALVFRDLSSLWHHDAADAHVDVFAAELAAQVAAAGAPVCLGLISKASVPKYFGLVFLLDSYGILIRKRYRQQGDAVFVYAEPRPLTTSSEFAGAVVRERRTVAPLPALARAA